MADARLDDVVVAEVAGDRLRLGGRLDDDEPAWCMSARHVSAGVSDAMRVTPGDTGRPAACRAPVYNVDRRRLSWPVAARRSTGCDARGRRAPARRGRLRARRQPHLELRPVAARVAALPAAVAALHGEVGAVLVRRSGRSLAAGGAFPVRRGERDIEAIETAVELCREGDIVVDVPGGDAAAEGPAQEARARGRAPGAARIALEAGVPLVPAAITGTDRLARLGRAEGRLRRAGPARRPRRPTPREAAQAATERLMAAIDELEASL